MVGFGQRLMLRFVLSGGGLALENALDLATW